MKSVILIADDDSTLRQDLRRQLCEQGHDLVEACNQAGILQVVRTCDPDLIILGSFGKSDSEVIQTAHDIRRWNKKVLLILIVTRCSEELAFAAICSSALTCASTRPMQLSAPGRCFCRFGISLKLIPLWKSNSFLSETDSRSNAFAACVADCPFLLSRQ